MTNEKIQQALDAIREPGLSREEVERRVDTYNTLVLERTRRDVQKQRLRDYIGKEHDTSFMGSSYAWMRDEPELLLALCDYLIVTYYEGAAD